MTKAVLKGSEKQVKWAEDIRKDMEEALEEYTEQMREKGKIHKVERYEYFLKKLNEIEESKFFIENRTKLFKYGAEYPSGVRRLDQDAMGTVVSLKKFFNVK